MLAIRLTRTGKIHDPHYRIVVQEKRSKLNGKAIDYVGHYHPAQADKKLVVDGPKVLEWIKKGAQPSDTVTNLLVKAGVLEKDQKVIKTWTKPEAPVAEEVAAPEAEITDEATANEVADAPEVQETLAEVTEAEATPTEEPAA